MSRAFQKLRAFTVRYAPYPLALQGVVSLALLTTLLSGFVLSDPEIWPAAAGRFWAMTALVGLHLGLTLSVPARRLPLWAQFTYLIGQCVLTVVAQALFPTPLFDYVYLTIVLQSLAIFRPWLWIPFAVGVWALWSGREIIATWSALSWLQSNLALAFPATCAIIAAIIYVRQHRRGEQAQQMLQHMQQRYDSLSTALRDLQQRVALEERRRLAQTLTEEVQSALARAEQSVTAALGQAQSNISRLQVTVAQTRSVASAAVDRLRGAITTLRRPAEDLQPANHPPLTLALPRQLDELVISAQPYHILSWVLPMVFIALSLPATLIQRPARPELLVPLMALDALLLLAYIYTQRAHNPLLLQIGLAGQTLAVIALAITTQALPILLGLLLVLWQIALRLPLSQIILFLTSVPAMVGLVLARMRPPTISRESLLVCGVAAAAVVGPLIFARRQLDLRHQAELRAALLSSEIDQQTAEVRTLAVAAERSRLAREFHDDLGSRLVLINLQLQLAEELAAESAEESLTQLRVSREQLRTAWRSVLKMADDELPLAGDTLGPALEDLASQCRRSALVDVDLCIDAGLADLSPAVACTIYRSVQEGMANACKHARPALIDVRLGLEERHVTVTVANDQRPAADSPAQPLAAASPRGSYGLFGLRERAEALGGGFDAGPLPEGGFRLMLVLPVEGGRDEREDPRADRG